MYEYEDESNDNVDECEQKDEGSSRDDVENVNDDGHMRDRRISREGKQDEDQGENGSEEGNDSIADMLKQVDSALVSRGLSGLKPPLSYQRQKPFQDHPYLGS